MEQLLIIVAVIVVAGGGTAVAVAQRLVMDPHRRQQALDPHARGVTWHEHHRVPLVAVRIGVRREGQAVAVAQPHEPGHRAAGLPAAQRHSGRAATD